MEINVLTAAHPMAFPRKKSKYSNSEFDFDDARGGFRRSLQREKQLSKYVNMLQEGFKRQGVDRKGRKPCFNMDFSFSNF